MSPDFIHEQSVPPIGMLEPPFTLVIVAPVKSPLHMAENFVFKNIRAEPGAIQCDHAVLRLAV